MVDEASRMSEEYFIASMPMLSIIKGSMDVASTPFGKRHKDGREKFFYKCSKDNDFKHYYISAEDCPRHSKDFLETQKQRMPKLAYAQEYMAVFTDELQRIFDDELLKKVAVMKRAKTEQDLALGCDIAGMGEDSCTYEVFSINEQEIIRQRDNIVERRNYTTDTSRKILELDKKWNFENIGIDDGGVGFGVYSELMNDDQTKRKTVALNNASRPTDSDGKKSKKILKEEMYILALTLMEQGKLFILDDDEVIASFASMQHEDGRIFGADSHIAEGAIRAIWLLEKNKRLNMRVYSIKV